MKLITDKVELNKLIASVTTQGKKLDAVIQLAGVSALAHLKEHGDIGFVNRLYLAMHKGARKSALTSWFLAHGSLVANTEQSKNEKPFNYTKDKDTNVEAAYAEMWFAHKPDASPDEVFDIQKAIHAIIKKAQGKQLAHEELLTGLQAMVTIPDEAGQMDEAGLVAGDAVQS